MSLYVQELSARYIAVRRRLRSVPVEAPRIIPTEAQLIVEVVPEPIASPVGCGFPHDHRITLQRIIEATSRQYGVKVLDIISQRRTPSIILPRHVAIYLARWHTTLSTTQIGKRMGGRDHSTAVHACQKIAKLIPLDTQLAAEIDNIKFDLGIEEI